MKILCETSAGEIIDKLSILKVKLLKIKNDNKCKNVKKEHDIISKIIKKYKINYDDYLEKLLNVNKKLWEIEDEIRIKEKQKQFDNEFICLARQVYKINDLRFKLKTKINILNDSFIQEEKEYIKYT
jgi:hypothetical protein